MSRSSQMRKARLTDRDQSIHDDELEQMFQKIDQLKDGDMLVLAGSIPASLPEDIYERIMERLQGRDIQIVVDANERSFTECTEISSIYDQTEQS